MAQIQRNQPLYEQLMWRIKAQVADGVLIKGEKLPSVREMALIDDQVAEQRLIEELREQLGEVVIEAKRAAISAQQLNDWIAEAYGTSTKKPARENA